MSRAGAPRAGSGVGRAVRASALAAVLGGAALLTTGAATVPATLPSTVGDLSSGREITRYDVTATLDADGVTRVTLDFDFDFGNDPGHGPYLTLPVRQGFDDTQDRLYRITDVDASSPSGAPAGVNREETTSALILRIGDEDVDDVSGVQSYVVRYTVDGWVNPASLTGGMDELNWNVIGPGWEIPISDVAVQVAGPADAQASLCFTGEYGSTTACTSSETVGPGAVFAQDMVPVGTQLTTVVGWPAGTFTDAGPILTEAYDPFALVRPLSVGGVLGVLVLAVGGFLAAHRVRKTGRDRAYLGLTPGLRPASGQTVASGYRDKRTPVSVQFTPPEGVRPGEVGTLVDEKADPVDVTATLIDLAVRGHLRIDEVPRSNPNKKPKDWTLTRLQAPDAELLAFERLLLAEVFEKKNPVKLSDLRTTFASSTAKVQSAMYEHVTGNGWFRANPKTVRTSWLVTGIALLFAGVLGTIFAFAADLQVPGLAWAPIALALVGILVCVLSGAAPARTETGTAVLAESLGFRRYLATAEANQIRFEEGQDVFSRYLPYAIVFGLADRWARVFAELAAQGRTIDPPTWYGGSYIGHNVFWATAFASSLDRFESVATESLTAPTPGSSGGSGFSGGGFSGGGVGGGGGGGW